MNKILSNQKILSDEINFLIVEDIPVFRKQLIKDMRALQIKGTIYEAENITEAYKLLNQVKFDFLICDWILPDGSGYDFLLAVKKMPEHFKTPFLIWTTKNEVSNILSAIAAGATEYFCKPWTQEELNTKIIESWNKMNPLP